MSKSALGIVFGAVAVGTALLIYANFGGWEEDATGSSSIVASFAAYLFMGFAAAILFVTVVIPWFSEKVGAVFYTTTEQIGRETDPSALAIAKLNQGDYEGALEEYRALSEASPEDRFPVAEMAKIALERLEDPEGARSILERALEEREWEIDDAAFFLFRLAEIYTEHLGQPEQALAIYESIIESFPETRHSANATHKLRDLESLSSSAGDQDYSEGLVSAVFGSAAPEVSAGEPVSPPPPTEEDETPRA